MEIIDNINHLLGDNIKQDIQKGSKLKIAASCFSIYAFEALKKELHKIDSLEFIFTSPTFVPDETIDKIKKEHRKFHIPKAERERSFYGSDFEIQLKNKLTQRAIAKECAEWIKRKARFKSNSGKSPMQQFACIENGENQSVYLPLQGFTAVDLGYQQGDAVSNIITKHNEPASTQVYLHLFDQIWSDPEKIEDVTPQLCDHIASVYKENPPEQVYFFMLYNIFNEFLEDINEDVLPNDLTGYQDSLIWKKLYNFQEDGATGIINKLETYNGCILADSVGLGKTFTALAVVKYYELRNKSVLVLCPKKLANNWLNYNRNLKTNIFAKDRFNYDVLCHTDLQRTSGESFGTPLDRINWGNYDLVVIDESHNFRNNDAFKDKETRYQKLMNSVIKDGVKTKVLMLSATPVNNRFNDLRNQLALAYEGDASILNKRLRTTKGIDEIFRRVQATFNAWAKFPPEERTTDAILKELDFDFFELLDSVTIARSRKHIQTFYDTTEIGSFPERRKPISYRSPLTNRKDVMGFNDIFRELSLLKLSIYAPVSYILPSRIAKYEELYDTEVAGGKSKLRQADREKSLQALLTTNLLKRLESSVEAFRITLNKLKNKHTETLLKIEIYNQRGEDKGVEDNSAYYENAEPDDDDFLEMEEDVTGGKVQIKLSDMDMPSWEHDLKADITIVAALLSEMQKITPEDDTKLQHLKKQIDEKIANPINPDNKKILVFTAFADTANYLYENLSDSLQISHSLHTGKVTGTSSPQSTLKPTLKTNYDFESLLTLFSPRSKEKDIVLPAEPNELDILIATDCISEGQNLQDCDYLINYDIHWNPVRIIQRFGRIDRIGSINTSIQLMNYWPDISLDEYINLKERVESRMVIADMAATGDDNVLSAKANDISYRKEQLKRLQEEVIEMEDLKSGVSITDLGLNDFRMDLLGYIKEHGDMSSIPNGMHAVVPAAPDKGLNPGVIFTLRNRNQSVNINQHNRLHPYYMVYIANDGEIIANHSEVKKLLDLVRSTCKGQRKPLDDICRLFNKETDDGRDMGAYSNLLKETIGSIIDLNEDKDIDSLFSGERTTALIDTIAGLDDFELINFLVVQEASFNKERV
ncbi:DEAD/DEAH box helicase family protein [Cardiobacterium sp. AH-315-I02]|nr:DEAD/DEAH box helicase family protein [Cardiobacterium sp. AH-315-I02]